MNFEIIKESPQSLDEALTIAVKEQNVRDRYKLRFGKDKHNTQVNTIRHADDESEPNTSRYRIWSKVRCYFCKMQGHIQRNCHKLKAVRERRNQGN